MAQGDDRESYGDGQKVVATRVFREASRELDLKGGEVDEVFPS